MEFGEDLYKPVRVGAAIMNAERAVTLAPGPVDLARLQQEEARRIPDDLKTEANAKFREMVRLANVKNVNLIMINHLKTKFESYSDPNTGAVKWRPTADYEMQGFDKAPFLVGASLWTKYTPSPRPGELGNFEMTVKKCRDNAAMVGSVFPTMPFQELMGILVPGVESWEE